MNFWETVLMFFSFAACIIAVFFVLKGKAIQSANVFFAILLLLFSYHIFFNVLYWSRFDEVLLVYLSLTDVIPLTLYGPLFFFYLRKVVKNVGLGWKDLIHFIPFFAVAGFRIGFFSLDFNIKLDAILSEKVSDYVLFIPGETIILSIITLSYGIFSFFRYVSNYKNDPELKIWLRAISFAFILFSVSCLVYFTVSLMGFMSKNGEYFICTVMVFFVFLTSYFAFIYPSIFNGRPIEKIIPFSKYQRTGLSKDFSLELKDKLLSVMQDERPYLDSEVDLNKIAQLLDISRHHASQIINEHFQVHFFDFVNNYRVEEAKKLLVEDKRISASVIDIAYQSGFNNRVSFYKAFKKFTGISPSEYKKLGATA